MSLGLLGFVQDMLWGGCSEFDFMKLFHDVSVLGLTLGRFLHGAGDGVAVPCS